MWCEKPAEWNIQTWYHLYSIDSEGEYKERKNWEGNENDHYCEEHAKKEGIIL